MSTQESTAPKIDSKDLSLEDLFKDFYSVPDFQREYVWEDTDVEALLNDSYDEFYESNGRNSATSEYFVGTIVTYKEDGVFQLIDGQQRLTTIYLILCVIRDQLLAANADANPVLNGCLHHYSLDAKTGKPKPNFRLSLQYEDSRGVLEKIAKGEIKVADIAPDTGSIERLLSAYNTIDTFLTQKFENKPAPLQKFFGAFLARIKLIRIVTPHVKHALKVFETINDRGVGLTAVDLLKNLLFMNTSQEDYDRLKKDWKTFVDALDSCKEKPLRFLRYFVMSQYGSDWREPLREEGIYDWFAENTAETGIDERPLEFVRQLVQSARVYGNFLKGKDPNGRDNPHVENTSAVGGKTARQHLILLLAGQHLPTAEFDELARWAENLFFCYILTRESTKNFERNFGSWSHQLRAIDDDEGLQDFLNETIKLDLKKRLRDFTFSFGELTTHRFQSYKLKYTLAKITQHLERIAWSMPVHESIRDYMRTKNEIEHILPRNPEDEVRSAFDKPEDYDAYVAKLGNLSLLEKTINGSVSNSAFEEKKPGYKESKFLINKALLKGSTVGASTTLNTALALLPPPTAWNSEAIDNRALAFVELAKSIWLPGIEQMASEGR